VDGVDAAGRDFLRLRRPHAGDDDGLGASFIGLLAAAYVNLAWTGLTDLPQWWGAGLSAVALVAIMRYA
jgi:predicted small integral membrane protein